MAASSCWGRGSATPAALLLLLGCALWWSTASAATTWDVGGAQKWTTGFNYSTWTAGKTFAVGDSLFFDYTSGQHDVDEVSSAEYTACTFTSPISSNTAGNTTLKLTTTGDHYYICTITGHCAAGMKLMVTVGASTGTSSPTSSPTSNSSSGSNSTGSNSVLTVPRFGYLAAIGSAVVATFVL